MTEEERLTKELVDELKKSGGYVKGHGPTYSRVMTADHKPVYNALKSTVDVLLRCGTLERDGLVVRLKKY